jgi:hypothetical protein
MPYRWAAVWRIACVEANDVSVASEISHALVSNASLTAMLPSCGLHQANAKGEQRGSWKHPTFARPDSHADKKE